MVERAACFRQGEAAAGELHFGEMGECSDDDDGGRRKERGAEAAVGWSTRGGYCIGGVRTRLRVEGAWVVSYAGRRMRRRGMESRFRGGLIDG